ncbi:hypothetical protein E4U58_002895 [Claviceps cyperi]|nr:hypothetical protein E4U58_002895 [Claviceps cyperi]
MEVTKNQVPRQKPKSFSDALTAPTSDLRAHQLQRPPREEDAGKRATCSIDIRTSEDPTSQIEGKLDSLTRGVADIPSKVCDEFMKRCVESEKELLKKSKEAEELRSEVQSLKEQLKQEKADGQDKVAGLTLTIQGLSEDKSKLREVILGNALRHEISDDEIRQRFVNIRQQIQAVVNKPAYDKTRDLMPRAAANDYEFRLRQQYNSYSPEGRVLFMRSIVYRIICHCILSTDIFGLAGSVPSPQFNQEAELDHFLGVFEGLLKTRKGAVVLYLLFSASSHANKPLVANELIFDWRLATFKCIESFNTVPHDNSHARGEIQRTIFPLLNHEWNQIGTEINRLCDDAFALRLLTRKSGDRYHFDGPTRGVECVPTKGTIEVCAVLGGGEASNCVEFSICGALIKRTGNEESEITCVLEPAHVVVQAKKSDKPPYLTRDWPIKC